MGFVGSGLLLVLVVVDRIVDAIVKVDVAGVCVRDITSVNMKLPAEDNWQQMGSPSARSDIGRFVKVAVNAVAMDVIFNSLVAEIRRYKDLPHTWPCAQLLHVSTHTRALLALAVTLAQNAVLRRERRLT